MWSTEPEKSSSDYSVLKISPLKHRPQSLFYSKYSMLKGIVSQDFRPLVFSSNNFPQAPDTWFEALLKMAWKSRRYLTLNCWFWRLRCQWHYYCENDPNITPLFIVNLIVTVYCNLPGLVALLPGMVAQLPGMVAQLPGMVAQLPGMVAQLPAMVAQLPGLVAQ
jgi:hypothetical protein